MSVSSLLHFVAIGRFSRAAAITALCVVAVLGASLATAQVQAPESDAWISLFNGEDLDDWTIKFRGEEVGVNYKDTFRVEDGLLRVVYDEYEEFKGNFGHIFHKDSFSHYWLRVEYRFVGDQVPGGPGWAFRNNGVMIHSQSPESMRLQQEFPVSIEVQLLGGDGTEERPTANLCSPGTHVLIDGEIYRQHCYNSTSETYHGDQWVTVEVEVRGNEIIRHIIDGEVVLEYTEPQLADRDGDARLLLEAGADPMLSEGYIALQAESHPTDFRKIELLPLAEEEEIQQQ